MSNNYISQLGTTPPVSSKEEKRLLQQVAQGRAAAQMIAAGNDTSAARRQVREGITARDTLIQANGRLVIKIAARYQRPELSLEELCQEGVIGLMRAIDKWRPNKGASKLSTYATWWIRQAVARAVHDQSRTVRLPANQSERLHRLRRVAETLGKKGVNPTIENIAATAGEPVETVQNLWRWSNHMPSLDEPVDDDRLRGDLVADAANTAQDAERALLVATLRDALGGLTPRSYGCALALTWMGWPAIFRHTTKSVNRFQVGYQFVTLTGEQDCDEDDQPRRALPGEVGTVGGVQHSDTQGYIYSVTFAPSGVWVFLDEVDLSQNPPYTGVEALE